MTKSGKSYVFFLKCNNYTQSDDKLLNLLKEIASNSKIIRIFATET